MRRFAIGVLVAVIAIISVSPYAFADRREYTLTGLKHPEAEKPKQGPSERDTEKPYADLIKDRVAIPGLFTFYQDTVANTMYMAIKPSQFNKVFLCGETMSKAEGAFFDNGMLTSTYPFYLQREGKKIMLMEKNLRFRADSTSSFRRAVEAGITDHLLASVKIESKPNDSGAVLIDPSALFVRDAENVSYFLGQAGQTGFSFDRDNSYFEKVKSFPENTEIDVKLHYRTNKPLNAVTMQNPYSMFHTYHYSLSTLPETDYVPRLADDRVGNFLTIYEDYSKFSPETPYVRYVERWNLKKKDPTAALSEPVEPIVYWVENTVPQEYKEWVAKGIEFWNPAFEKIGFKNAIVAKIMPDTASWDPADTRYNVVRWIMRPGAGYAVGPSRANPFTGQIYDADIRVSADFIRYMYNNATNWIHPLSFDGSTTEQTGALDSIFPGGPASSEEELSRESAQEAAFGLNYLLASTDNLEQRDSLTKDYIHQYIVQLVAHEVGHTLGLRHNFKASSIYTLDQINDTAFTHKNSTLGTIMDYMPPNVAGRGKVQGDFYPTVPGPYDNWAIAYAYSDFGGKTPQDDTAKLNEIAQRAGDPLLAYGTDEDLGGMDPNRSVDPLCNTFDQGTDVIKFAALRIDQARELWNVEMKDFERPGQRYQKIMTVFSTGWRPYTEATRWVPKFVGGI
ncbi:MAG TPA: zinc-dependent metalloprotease, partial [Candidatus Acidoferrum sp.]|nr:zinc-dependent metalloprotease [Candidatus Acidoferrum sp.]